MQLLLLWMVPKRIYTQVWPFLQWVMQIFFIVIIKMALFNSKTIIHNMLILNILFLSTRRRRISHASTKSREASQWYLFMICCSSCIRVRCNTLWGKHYPPLSIFMSVQTPIIRRKRAPSLPHRQQRQFCSLGIWTPHDLWMRKEWMLFCYATWGNVPNVLWKC